jgi:hypothetical protein
MNPAFGITGGGWGMEIKAPRESTCYLRDPRALRGRDSEDSGCTQGSESSATQGREPAGQGEVSRYNRRNCIGARDGLA